MKTFTLLAIICLFIPSSQAETIVGTGVGHVSGFLSGGNAAPPPGIALNDPVYFRWQYDDSMAPSFTTLTKAIYRPYVSMPITVEIGSYQWIASGGTLEIVNDDSTEGDRLSIFADQQFQIVSFPGSLGGFGVINAFRAFDLTSPFTLLCSLDLPRQTSDIDLFVATQLSTGIFAYGPGPSADKWAIYYEIDPETVLISAVPEPSTATLIICGLVLVGRRNRPTPKVAFRGA